MEEDPFLRWRRAQADNARTLAALAETCGRIAEGQAALARALAQTRDGLGAAIGKDGEAGVGRPSAAPL